MGPYGIAAINCHNITPHMYVVFKCTIGLRGGIVQTKLDSSKLLWL